MTDYSKGKIYKIYNNINDDIYVGSTVERLCVRMAKHRATAKLYKYKSKNKLHPAINEYGVDNFYIELIENYPCNNTEELRAKEGEWIRQIGTLNYIINGRTNEQYRNEHKEVISEKAKQYRQDHLQEVRAYEKSKNDANREKVRDQARNKYQKHQENILQQIKERCVCECGIDVNKHHIARHRKTDKHKRLMETKSHQIQ